MAFSMLPILSDISSTDCDILSISPSIPLIFLLILSMDVYKTFFCTVFSEFFDNSVSKQDLLILFDC